jgi:hypothetical protein
MTRALGNAYGEREREREREIECIIINKSMHVSNKIRPQI